MSRLAPSWQRVVASSRPVFLATSRTSLARPRRIPQHPLPIRNISILRWRRTPKPVVTAEGIPVYFSSAASAPRRPLRRTVGRALIYIVVAYACWQFFAATVIDPLLDWADEEYEKLSEKEKKEMDEAIDEDEELLFLPFPFTTKSVKQPPYKGSDPEWQMFISVNRDAKWRKEIKQGLMDLLKRGVERNPGLVRLLGGKNIKVQKAWIDIIYPDRPPPQHFISGVSLDESGLSWTQQQIDSQVANRLDMALYPKAVAVTAWTFVKVLMTTTANDIAAALGFESSQGSEVTWQAAVMKRAASTPNVPPGMGGPPAANTTVTAISRPQGAGSPSPSPQAPGVVGSTIGSEIAMDPRIFTAMQAASLVFAKNWRPAQIPPNKGCIRIDGFVEMAGKQAIMVVYVWGWYDPKLKKYMGIQSGVKHIVPVHQKPARR